jgi:uncharacterized membrane protein YhdT
MAANSRNNRIDEIDAWWALLSRILAFCLGCVLAYNLQKAGTTALWPWAVVAALMGPVVAASLAEIARAFRVGGEK